MENIEIYIQSLVKFQSFVKELNGDEKHNYILYIQSSQKDTLSIISEYNRMNKNSEHFFKGNSIEIVVIIEIQKHSDYKGKFGDIFCQPLHQDNTKKTIKSEYQSVKYKFKIISKDDNLIDNYYKLGMESVYPGIWQNISGAFEFDIYTEENYKFFNDIEKRYNKNKLFNKTEFKFHIYLDGAKHANLFEIYEIYALRYAHLQNISGFLEIEIREKEDYSFFTKFENKYSNNSIFERTEFKFHIYLQGKKDIELFRTFIKYAHLKNISGIFEIDIYKEKDYDFFYEFENEKLSSGVFERTEFKLHIYLQEKEYINLLRNYVNNASKYACVCKMMTNKVYFETPNLENTKIYANGFSKFIKDHECEIDGKTQWKKVNSEDILMFNIDISNVGFDLSFLHNYMLFCCKFKKHYRGVILNLISNFKDVSEEDRQRIKEDKQRIKAYISANLGDGLYVVFNKELLINDISSVGKLPPAIYVTKENENEFIFLKNPLSKEIWSRFVERESKNNEIKPINSTTFSGTGEEMSQKYWPMLRMCQKFLFDEFLYSKSKAYTELRTKLYSSEQFYEQYVCRIPFLALCIFALYDEFFRNDLLQKYKEKTKITRLNYEDIILSKQKEQKWERFDKYENSKKEFDIKNLIVDTNGDLIIMHKTVESEIFEAVMIAEGILQILENAVLHAGGGLLSMRIYSRAKGMKKQEFVNPEHEKYLIDTYGKNYLDYLKTNFFLEVYVSDLSNMSIPEKFIENHCNDEEASTSKEKQKIKDFLINNKSEINLRYFFEKFCNSDEKNSQDKVIKKIKRGFYKLLPENIVYHYGLDVFNSILTSRAGLLSVAGYKDSYDNLDDLFGHVYESIDSLISNGDDSIVKIVQITNCSLDQIKNARKKEITNIRRKLQTGKSLNGTSYRILLPLNHLQTNNINYSTNELVFKENIVQLNEKNETPIVIGKDEILNDKKLYDPSDKDYSIKHKEWNINIIATTIETYYDDTAFKNGKCLCLNLYENGVERKVDTYFEEIIKGIVLFALRKTLNDSSEESTQLPIAIVNLTSFHLVEAARQIAMFFSKKYSENDLNMFKKIPIYLKSIEPGKEIVFDGKDLTEIIEKILKTSMANAIMYNELSTIVDIMRSITDD